MGIGNGADARAVQQVEILDVFLPHHARADEPYGYFRHMRYSPVKAARNKIFAPVRQRQSLKTIFIPAPPLGNYQPAPGALPPNVRNANTNLTCVSGSMVPT